jgi:hypothetical protein
VIYLCKAIIKQLNITVETRFDLVEDLNIMAVQIRFAHLKYQIWNIYLPLHASDGHDGEEVRDLLRDQTWPQNAMITGDLNCTAPLWGDKKSRLHITTSIEDKITEFGYSVITPRNAATWHSTGKRRTEHGMAIDMVMAGPTILNSITNLVVDKTSYLEGDHAMQRFSINWGTDKQVEVLNVDKFNIEGFVETVQNLRDNLEPQSIGKWDNIITAAIHTSSPRVIPRRVAAWWDNTLSLKKAEIRSLECKLQMQNVARDPTQRETSCAIEDKTREFTSSLWRSKESHYRHVIEQMDHSDIWQVMKWWQGIRQTLMPSLRGPGGEKITDSLEKARVLHRAWFPIQNDNSVALMVQLLQEMNVPRQQHCEGWMQYLTKAFMKPATRKALRLSGIKYMHYRELLGNIIAKLLSIVQTLFEALLK